MTYPPGAGSLISEQTEEEKKKAENKTKEELQHTKELIEEARGQIERDQYIQVTIPVDQLLAANRKDRQDFFKKTISEIKAKLEIIKIQRRTK